MHIFTPIAGILLCFASLSNAAVILVSVDGFRIDYLTDPNVTIPNIRALSGSGYTVRKGVVGVLPTVTYPSHTTLVTGVNPSQHGIEANKLFDPTGIHHHWPPPNGTGEEWFWNYTSIQSTTLFGAVKKAGGKSGAVFWPVTMHGESEIDRLVPEIWPNAYVDPSARGVGPDVQAVLDELDPTKDELVSDAIRWRIASRFIAGGDLDLLAIHYAELDSAQHAWGVFSPQAYGALQQIDTIIGNMVDQLEAMGTLNKTTIFVTADHGFTNIYQDAYPNTVLSTFPKAASASWGVYCWTAGGSGGIFVHPNAPAAAYEAVDALVQNTTTMSGWGVDSVLSAAEAEVLGGWKGAYKVLSMKEGYYLQNEVAAFEIAPSRSRGSHGFLPSFRALRFNWIMNGPAILPGENIDDDVYAVQIAPTIAQILNVKLDAYQGSTPATRTPLTDALNPDYPPTFPTASAPAPALDESDTQTEIKIESPGVVVAVAVVCTIVVVAVVAVVLVLLNRKSRVIYAEVV